MQAAYAEKDAVAARAEPGAVVEVVEDVDADEPPPQPVSVTAAGRKKAKQASHGRRRATERRFITS
jgi:hypothetical protein